MTDTTNHRSGDDHETGAMKQPLRASEHRFAKAFHFSPIGNIIVRRRDASIIEINDAYLQIMGYTRDELVGAHISILRFMPESALRAELAEAFDQGRAITGREVTFTRKDGSTGQGLHSSHPLDIDGEKYGLGTLIDITERKQMEQSLRDSTLRLEATLEGGGMGTWIWNIRTGELWWDEAATKLWGRRAEDPPPHSAEDAMQFIHPDDRERVQESFVQYLRTGIAVSGAEFRTLRPDGALQWISSRGWPQQEEESNEVVRMVGVFIDTTARRRAEESQLRSQKMEALGTLAGGIAHDFNNILLAIAGNVKLAIADLPQDHPVQGSLGEIDKASARATDLVRRILTFSRQQEPRREVASLQPIIEEAMRLIRPTLPTMVDIRMQLAADAPPVSIDPIQIHQIIMNLATNAAHAIGARGGLIEVTLDTATIDPQSTLSAGTLLPGRYARLTVSDNGAGMDKQTRERMFDPFFTTKPAGQGTGLGLSVVHGIVKNLGGAICVYSQPGKGTTLQIYFPAVEPGDTGPQIRQLTAAPGRGERVLYVDDEESLVFLATRVLQRLGYQVHGCTSPVQALSELRANPRNFDAVITDLSMHPMSGFELARALLEIRPDLPILMTSGYVRTEDRENARQCGIRDFILKPDTIEELSHALQRIFAGAQR